MIIFDYNIKSMEIIFTGAGFRREENENLKINMPEGSKEYIVAHFYSPMIFELQGRIVETKPNACIIFKPGTPLIYHGKNGGFINDFIRFLPESTSFFDGIDLPFDEIFYVNNDDVIKPEMNDFVYLNSDRWFDNSKALEEVMRRILEKLQENRIQPSAKNQRENEIRYKLKKLREEVERNPQNWNVDLMADFFSLTRSHFSVLYKNTFGISPKEDIHAFLNKKAIHLLETTDMTIKDISIACNYNECENFIRAFKKNNGISPLQYRKNSFK